MAVLSNSDFAQIKRMLRSDPVAVSQVKSANLSKDDWKSVLQALEDDFESRRVTLKGIMDTAAGTTLTATMAKKLAKAWMTWKLGGE